MYNRYLQYGGAPRPESALSPQDVGEVVSFSPAEASADALPAGALPAGAFHGGGSAATVMGLLQNVMKRLRLTELALDDILLLAIVFLVLRQSEDDNLLLILAALFFLGFFDRH